MSYNHQEELARIESIKSIFELEGWALFLEDMKTNLASVNTISGVDGLQELGIRQGQTQILGGILNYETLIEATENQINEDINAPEESDA